LHRELELFVEAGLTPMQALQAATRNPARFLGELDRAGTVEPGKIANLLLLTANPLDDIRNTQKIDSVVLRGKLVHRAVTWTSCYKLLRTRRARTGNRSLNCLPTES
jgi:imidazolonepropionase-like amidohydrolase